MRWQSRLLVCSVMGVVIVWLQFGYLFTPLAKSRGRSDLAVYYAASQVVTGHTDLITADIYHKTLFRPLVQSFFSTGGTYFLYTPIAAQLLAPLSLFSFQTIVWLWRLMNVLIFLGTFIAWMRLLQLPLKFYFWLLALAAAPPVIRLIDTGQINLVVFALLTLGWMNLSTKRHAWLVGCSLAVATVLKIFPIIFLPYLLLKKQYQAAACYVFALAASLAVSVATFGVTGWQLFLTDRLPTLLAGSIGNAETSISLYGALRTSILSGTYNFLGDRLKDIIAIIDQPYQYITFLFGTSLIIYLWYTRKRKSKRQFVIDYGLIIMWILLTSEIVHQHYIIWLAPLLLWLGAQWGMQSRLWKSLYAVAVTLVLFQHYIPKLDTIDLLIKPVTLGLVLLLACATKVVYYNYVSPSPSQQ